MSAVTPQTAAREAIFQAIPKAIAALESGAGATARAQGLRDLALAYRYLAGGPQPGGVNVEK